jgi:hypothetical protein
LDPKVFLKVTYTLSPAIKYGVWPEIAIEITGAANKDEYRKWCSEHRLPVIKKWIEEHSPKIFIGVGIERRTEFSFAIFGKSENLSEYIINVNGHEKRIFYHVAGNKKLVVVPHFSGPSGLNSDVSLQKTGEFITSIMNSKSIGNS